MPRIPAPRGLQQPQPLTFQYKRSLHSNLNKMVLCNTSPPSSQSAGFLNKVPIPFPNNSYLHLLACPEVSSMSLDSNKGWSRSLFLCIANYYSGFPGSSVGKESACSAGSSVPGLGKSTGGGIDYPLQYSWASLVAQLVKNLPAMRETWVWSLGWEDSLERGTVTHFSILAWRISWTV